MPIGITITESAQATPSSAAQPINRAIMVGFALPTTATDENKPIAVTSAADFANKVSGESDTLVASVNLFFLNYPEGKLLYVGSKDPAIATASDPGHIRYGLQQLTKRTDLDLAIITIPEVGDIVAQADRTAIYSDAEALCQKLDWLHFMNTATTVNTKALALTERNLYASPLGHSAIYYGMITDLQGRKGTTAAVAAAIALRRFKEDSPFSPPAGARYPLTLGTVIGYIDTELDYIDLRDKGINVIQNIPKIGYCLWGARTLATDPKFQQINSRAANSIVSRQLQDSLLPMLFEPSDPQGYTRREVIRIAVSIMQSAYVNGGLSGATPEEAFRIEEIETEIPINPATTQVTGTGGTTTLDGGTSVVANNNQTLKDLRVVQIKLFARFVDTLEMIEIQLVNVDLIPTEA